MGTNSKQKSRQVNFQGALGMLSQMQDQKFLQYAKEFTQTLTILTAKVTVLEKIAKDKLNYTQADLEELFFDEMDNLNGIPKNEGAISATGDRVRIRFAQGLTQEETDAAPQENTIIILGKNQVHANLDTALTGLKAGDTFSVTLPPQQAGGKDVYVQGTVQAVYSMKQGTLDAKETPTQTKAE